MRRVNQKKAPSNVFVCYRVIKFVPSWRKHWFMEQEENGNTERDANGNTERDDSETEEMIESSSIEDSNTSIEMEKSETGRRTSIFKFYEYKNVSSTGESGNFTF